MFWRLTGNKTCLNTEIGNYFGKKKLLICLAVPTWRMIINMQWEQSQCCIYTITVSRVDGSVAIYVQYSMLIDVSMSLFTPHRTSLGIRQWSVVVVDTNLCCCRRPGKQNFTQAHEWMRYIWKKWQVPMQHLLKRRITRGDEASSGGPVYSTNWDGQRSLKVPQSSCLGWAAIVAKTRRIRRN